MDKNEIISWLKETNSQKLDRLWQQADSIRKQNVGDAVHLRGLIELTNHCARLCSYCGLRAENNKIERYRMTRSEIMACVSDAVSFGYGTVVIQGGEDYGIKAEWLADIIREIKATTPLAVTLSMGERPLPDIMMWKQAGADRYLLRFETSEPDLYQRIHPALPKETVRSDANDAGRVDSAGLPCTTPANTPGKWPTPRLKMLNELRRAGYETGGGVMIGIPGQSYDILAEDILWFRRLDIDMLGVGPYIPHPDTPLANTELFPLLPPDRQVPNTELMVYKVVALARIMCPQANIPSTTALATINTDSGRELGLLRGANVVMPNLTPVKYRNLYEIYPGKACINETAGQCRLCLQGRIASIGRYIGSGPGSRVGFKPASSPAATQLKPPSG